MQRLFRTIAAFALVGMAATAANAGMQVAPVIMEIPNRPGATGSIRVENTGTKEIPVAISVVQRRLDADGKLQTVPADGDFVIFPPQAVIGGREAQQFRFQYLGTGDLAQSVSYYVYASQLPVDLDAEDVNQGFRARLNFLYEYGVAVHAIPEGAEPQLVVDRARPVTLDGGGSAVELTITNVGNRFGRASEHNLSIEAGGETLEYTAAQLKKGLKNGMWLPGQTHVIKFSTKKRAPANIEATFEYVGG